MGQDLWHYEVLVSSPKYHRDSALTYSSGMRLETGSLVTVPLQKEIVPALVLKGVEAPDFAVREITSLISSNRLPGTLLKLLAWLKDYYPASMGQLTPLLLPANLTKKRPEAETSEASHRSVALPPLTAEQSSVLRVIELAKRQPVLLHGDTGTGKTRIYMELIKEEFAKGKSVLLLTPEIGLTPQLAAVCDASYPGRSVTVHSGLSPRVRYQAWLKILESPRPLVVVGARSALFAPLRNVGLIVVDEFHETSYKQEQAPHYSASHVAAQLATLHKARLVLGSATPPIFDYFVFERKELPIVRMRQPALKHISDTSTISVLDLKKREEFTRSPWLSDKLLQAIDEALQQQKQSLLFLNRRGTARLVVCSACGWRDLCPHCDLALTYHGDDHRMRCHTCGFTKITPTNCQNCGKKDILFKTVGTKSLVTELEGIFPYANIKRFDSDTTKADSLEKNYAAIKAGRIDILVGTQMLGKGLDLPRLSVLGVVLADTSLAFPDYTAEERTFQLLTQVVGRVNRGHTPGNVFIQTYSPDSPLLRAALKKDYEAFYRQQIQERQRYGFPPFRFTLKLACNYGRQSSTQQAAKKLATHMARTFPGVEVIGPSPAFIEKKHGRYYWQVIVKSRKRTELIKVIKELPSNWAYDIDPINLL